MGAVATCLSVTAPRLLGQTDRDESQQVDRLLNISYQQVWSQLPPAGREKLRKAERAWLVFVELDKIAMREAAARLGLSKSAAQDFETGEVNARIRQLEDLLESQDSSEPTAVFRQNDAQLNIVYQRCITSLSPAELAALRKAQRAWLVFRNESRKFGGLIAARITAARTAHLNAFYIQSAAPPPIWREDQPVAERKADPNTPDPFERAR